LARRLLSLLVAPALAASVGCFETGIQLNPFAPAAKPAEPTVDSFILRTDGKLVTESSVATMPADVTGALDQARDAYRKEDYAKAETLFGVIADKDKNPPLAIQEAIYYRAECLRLTGHLPKACDTYASLLNKFPTSSYREQCCQRMYDIANYWLDDTWDEMKRAKEGKSWVVMPAWFSFERAKPFFDREGRAVEAMERVRLHDIQGPLADQALYRCGVVKMYREDWREADHYFSQISAKHPESKLAPQAIQLAVFCKQMATGGSSYDGRKTAEARKLIQTALTAYPEIAGDPEKRKYLEKQSKAIDLQQAEKEFKMAEFYRRTGHPGSAYFYYELVQRRYPKTKYAEEARARWASLRDELIRSGQAVPAQPKPAAAPATTPAVQPVNGWKPAGSP
jgi:outer membrane protein assembly factor BamD (BamD/ComL family)